MEDFHRTKRTIYIILAVIILAILGFWAYQPLLPEVPARREPASQDRATGRIPEGAGGSQNTPTLPLEPGVGTTTRFAEESPALLKLTNFPVVSPSLNPAEDRILFYQKNGGDLNSIDFRGEDSRQISNLTVIGILEAEWSPSRDRAVVRYLDQDTIKSFLHIGTSSIAVLPSGIRSAAFSPNGKELAYLISQEDKYSLIVTDAAGRNPRTIASTLLQDANLSWPSADRIILETAPSAYAEGYAFTVSRSTGSQSKILGPLFGLTANWSKYSLSAFLSHAATRAGDLSVSLYGINSVVLKNIPPTLADKCVWTDGNELYCAVPRTIPTRILWPDDYLRGELNTSDRVVLIDAGGGGVREILNQGNFDISNLILTKNKERLFFVDRRDGALWTYKIR